jgi:hypothetical protein
MNASEWNTRYPIGQTVRLTLSTGESIVTYTAGAAIAGAACDLIAVHGAAKGYVPLGAVQALPQVGEPA